MAAESTVEKLRQEATCLICLDYLVTPVTLDCGHNFCHACILKVWRNLSRGAACPRCKESVPWLTFEPNEQLGSIVGLIKQLCLRAEQPTRGAKTCNSHSEGVTTFCKDDGALVCCLCEEFKEHQSHTVLPVHEVAQSYKDRFVNAIGLLRKSKEEILQLQSELEKECEDLIQVMEKEMHEIGTRSEQVRDFVQKKWDVVSAKREELDEAILLKKNGQASRLSRELSFLENGIRELEERCQQPVLESLQDADSILKMYEKKEMFVNSVALFQEEKQELWKWRGYNAHLMCAMKNFEDCLLSEYPAEKDKITLDPNTDQAKCSETEFGPQDSEEI